MVSSEQFKGGDEGRNEQAQECIYPTDVSKLVCVCQVSAVPGEQEIALVVRSEGEMESISYGIARHHSVADISFYHVRYWRFDSEERKRFDESETLLLASEVAAFKLFDDSDARDKLVPCS